MDDRREAQTVQPLLGELESALIDEFVRSRGHDPSKLGDIPQPTRDELLKQASLHASSRMAEVEARSHYLHDIHDVPAPPLKRGRE